MPLVLPYPTVPTNGQPLDATPMLANIQAIAQAIQSFDGSQVQAGSLVAAAFNANINPNTLLNETTVPFVKAGTVVWSIVSGLNGAMTSGFIYFNGIRVPVSAVASNAFAANKDIYIDIDVNGNITYQAVANGATSPALTANSIRVAKVVTGATITSIQQWGVDAAATTGQVNYIYNTSPNAAPIFAYANPGSATGSFYYRNQSGVKEFWGTTAATTGATAPSTYQVTFPVGFFNTIPVVNLTLGGNNTANGQAVNIAGSGVTAAFVQTTIQANATTSPEPVQVYARGF
jgi:hypothetical protein